MNSNEIRSRFLDFFAGKGHTVVPSSSLVPMGDQTLLFTNAGMVQFKSVFLNDETRDYVRAVTCQKCMRAGGKHNDLENVGRTARHHTFFEMLGNFSFGDYFKKEAIEFAWEFLTKEMALPIEKLWITVFETDDEALGLWKEVSGLTEERIIKMGEKDNFWSMGDTGPCGPCSEILVDQGPEMSCGKPDCAPGCDCDRYLEIWNLVFMQYNRDEAGELAPLPSPCIDTGMGLERLSAVMQSKKSNYDTDLFLPVINRIEELTGRRYGENAESDVSIKAIADHSRAITFLMTDGVLPSNEGRGYVLRRIIRRAARHGRFLGIKKPFLYRVNNRVIELLGGVYPDIARTKELIYRATKGEEERFFETLERGLSLLDSVLGDLKEKGVKTIPGDAVFKLYDTFGFPIDLTADIVRREGFSVDEKGFEEHMAEQRKKARAAWKGVGGEATAHDLYNGLVKAGLASQFVGYHMEAISSRVLCIIKNGASVESAGAGDAVEIVTEETPFYGESGGQTGDSGIIAGKGFAASVTETKKHAGELTIHHCTIEQGSVSVDDTVELVPDRERRDATRRNHTATHILHAVLRKTIGEHVRQAGSLVSPDGLRFDFNHFEPLGRDELKKIEQEANQSVLSNIEVRTEVLAYDEAVRKGALAFFGEKYAEMVRMVQVAGVSTELCGGTHVRRTGDIGLIKILAEGSVAAGVRRIEAVTGAGALAYISGQEDALRQSAEMLKVPRLETPDKIKRLIEQQKELERELEGLKGRSKAGAADALSDKARDIKGIKVLAAKVHAADAKELREMADALRLKLGSGIVVLAAEQEGKAVLLAAVTTDLCKRMSAGELIKRLAPVVGGRGGGKSELAQAGGVNPEKIDEAIELAYRIVEELA